ncbi:MAG: hypothetical protein SF339_02700 [Blastocatellia bacterium]|nr:hypothetical protein [Blastocatellia bacterium]
MAEETESAPQNQPDSIDETADQFKVTIDRPVAISPPQEPAAVVTTARERAAPVAPSRPPARPKTAILVCHGMGQQVQFSTLNDVVKALGKAQENLIGQSLTDEDVSVQMIRFEDSHLPRAKVSLRDKDGNRREVHLYEAYWAVLTEGKVSPLDVLKFLIDAGRAGIKFAVNKFERWMFGDWQTLPLRKDTVLLLIMAVLIVCSVAALGFSFFIALASKLLGVMGVVNAGLPVVNMLIAHVFGFLYSLLAAGLLLGLLMGVHLLWSAIRGRRPQTTPRITLRIVNVAMGLLFLLATAPVGLSLFYHLYGLLAPPSLPIGADLQSSGFENFVSQAHAHFAMLPSYRGLYLALWIAAALAFYVGKGFLVTYVGDVAAYVSAHKVNKFYELRQQIKDAGLKIARAAYEARNPETNQFEYDEIIVVGHSLGSVVAYDTLNSMINRDLGANERLDVVKRTKALITFGSPLDKTAFLFRAQAEHEIVRESLAAAVQPLIQSYAYRPARWINIWSRLDWISGPLEYYDSPTQPDPDKAVENLEDLDASFPMAAHTQYWRHRIFGETLYRQIDG